MPTQAQNNNTLLDKRRLMDRQTDELIGICKGILFDGIVTFDEARNLSAWFEANPYARDAWPGKALYAELSGMLGNGALSSGDERLLLILLGNIIGLPDVVSDGGNASTQLPLTVPAPEVKFINSLFVLTGNFSIGTREQVTQLIEARLGYVSSNTVRKDTDYLVIGDIGSKAWTHSTHGRKIEKAMPSFSVEFNEDDAKPWGVYGLSTPQGVA